jgi:hypothetical protein
VLWVGATLPEHKIAAELLPQSSIADEKPPRGLVVDVIEAGNVERVRAFDWRVLLLDDDVDCCCLGY